MWIGIAFFLSSNRPSNRDKSGEASGGCWFSPAIESHRDQNDCPEQSPRWMTQHRHFRRTEAAGAYPFPKIIIVAFSTVSGACFVLAISGDVSPWRRRPIPTAVTDSLLLLQLPSLSLSRHWNEMAAAATGKCRGGKGGREGTQERGG